MWNGRNTVTLARVYQKITFYKEVDLAWHDGEHLALLVRNMFSSYF